jgi:hypothetical protein
MVSPVFWIRLSPQEPWRPWLKTHLRVPRHAAARPALVAVLRQRRAGGLGLRRGFRGAGQRRGVGQPWVELLPQPALLPVQRRQPAAHKGALQSQRSQRLARHRADSRQAHETPPALAGYEPSIPGAKVTDALQTAAQSTQCSTCFYPIHDATHSRETRCSHLGSARVTAVACQTLCNAVWALAVAPAPAYPPALARSPP